MSPRVLFTLVLRGLGAYEFLNGLNYFITALNAHYGYDRMLGAEQAYLNHGIEGCVVGAILVIGAAHISAFFVAPLPAMGTGEKVEQQANV